MPQKLLYSTMVKLVLGDITKANAEAIINDARSDLKPERGPNKAIHDAAGPALMAECKRHIDHEGPLEPGPSMRDRWRIIESEICHTCSRARWSGGQNYEEGILADTYQNAFKVAADYSLTTVAVTPLAIGEHARYPVEKSAIIAISSLEEFCRSDERLKEIMFVISDQFVYSVFQKLWLISVQQTSSS